MKLVIEVKRRRMSVTQGVADVYVNGQKVITFGDAEYMCGEAEPEQPQEPHRKAGSYWHALMEGGDNVKEGDMGDPYKVEWLKKMLEHETSKTEEHYGARLSHWYGDSKILTIDAGGLRALIRHYSKHDTNLDG